MGKVTAFESPRHGRRGRGGTVQHACPRIEGCLDPVDLILGLGDPRTSDQNSAVAGSETGRAGRFALARVPKRRRRRDCHGAPPQGRKQCPSDRVKWARRHDDEVTVVELAEDGLDQQLGQATAGSGEKGRRGIQARPGASRQGETAEGEPQGDPVSLGLCRRAEQPQAEPFAICDDCIEPVQVLNVLEKDPFAERPLQVRGVRQSSSRGEVTCRRYGCGPGPPPRASSGDRRAEWCPILRARRTPDERPCPAGRLAAARGYGPSAGSREGSRVHRRATSRTTSTPAGRPPHRRRCPSRGAASSETVRRGADAKLRRSERHPMIVGDGQAGAERRKCATPVPRRETAERLPHTHARTPWRRGPRVLPGTRRGRYQSLRSGPVASLQSGACAPRIRHSRLGSDHPSRRRRSCQHAGLGRQHEPEPCRRTTVTGLRRNGPAPPTSGPAWRRSWRWALRAVEPATGRSCWARATWPSSNRASARSRELPAASSAATPVSI